MSYHNNGITEILETNTVDLLCIHMFVSSLVSKEIIILSNHNYNWVTEIFEANTVDFSAFRLLFPLSYQK